MDLISLELDNQIVAGRAFLVGDSAIASTYGTSAETVSGLACTTCAAWDYPLFNRVIGAGILAPLDERGLDAIFVDLTVASLRTLGDRSAGFIASVDGADAGTGQLVLSERVAGCYSGSVLEAFRGRGIQHALIAARVAEGLRRGRRIFISQ